MRYLFLRASLAIYCLIPTLASAQTVARRVDGMAPPPVRVVGSPIAVSGESFAMVTNARALPGGLVLANDVAKRRVLLLDSSLALVRVVVDSANNPANYYGNRPGGLIAYKGDSTLFVDAGDLTMMVIDPKGNIARVMSVPSAQDASALTSMAGAIPGFDGAGRLVYKTNPRMVMSGLNGKAITTSSDGGSGASGSGTSFSNSGVGGAAPSSPTQPDSAALQRVDIASRKVDTAAFVKIAKSGMTVTQSANGGFMMSSQINPMPLVDEWAVMDDGSIAVVRGQDYHVDWITPDGKRVSSPKIAFDWQRLSDDDKVAFIDSAKKARDAAPAGGQAMSMGGASAPAILSAMVGGSGQTVVTGKTVSVGGDGGARQVMTFGNGGGGLSMPQMDFIPAAELPDYRPAFGAGATRADRDGNLWVQTTAVVKGGEGGLVYDVINRKGELVDRVQLQTGRTVVGFGPGGVLYLLARTDLGTHLERAKAK